MFSDLPLRWNVIALAAFFAIMAVWTATVIGVVSALPQWAVDYLFAGMIGAIIGGYFVDWSLRREIEKRWDYDPLADDPERW